MIVWFPLKELDQTFVFMESTGRGGMYGELTQLMYC